MSDSQIKVKINRIVAHSGFEKSEALISPVLKVMQMRYKDLDKKQVLRITKEVLA